MRWILMFNQFIHKEHVEHVCDVIWFSPKPVNMVPHCINRGQPESAGDGLAASENLCTRQGLGCEELMWRCRGFTVPGATPWINLIQLDWTSMKPLYIEIQMHTTINPLISIISPIIHDIPILRFRHKKHLSFLQKGNKPGIGELNSNQWEFQDPKMEVLYHIRPYFLGIFPYIGLI